ncbi:hypothetical protein J2X68_007601 [Streptomyces sp. 3330]|uniref:hypothetical protein n=1 Tax=Streptomyces sp. 3330 TaxID=2817755 RepID=UPI00285E5A96|nr:hypothetical protein [Streptomyces sp. 3330]MDR6980859.1 hypothetical protein [Streptomyces sp. 3330]
MGTTVTLGNGATVDEDEVKAIISAFKQVPPFSLMYLAEAAQDNINVTNIPLVDRQNLQRVNLLGADGRMLQTVRDVTKSALTFDDNANLRLRDPRAPQSAIAAVAGAATAHPVPSNPGRAGASSTTTAQLDHSAVQGHRRSRP